MGISLPDLIPQVQVNIPFGFLVEEYLDRFLSGGLNPEIGLDAVSLERYPRSLFQKVARSFQKAARRITLHAPFQDLLPGALDEFIRNASRRRLHQAFQLLSVFRPESIVCHPGYEARHYQHDRKEWLRCSAATWKEFTRIAADQGVRVMLENVYETDPLLFLDLLEQVNAPNLGVCLDVGHLSAFGGGNFPLWLETLGPVIGQLHLHDNHGDDDTHLALGAGEIPLAEVLNYLAKLGPPPLITLEPHQEGSLQPSLEHLAQIWPWG
ncbi:MAG: sugar phosphate isomerase/epimerase [Deltaproteobacteria bacterium]|nr:sugar phosphate isomerase/epimerase [Deltaproteobacteria bacterium]